MLDQGNKRLEVLTRELEYALTQLIADGSQFYELRKKTRLIAPEYTEFIVWSPELRDVFVVVDIWDHAWTRLASVSVRASKAMINAKKW